MGIYGPQNPQSLRRWEVDAAHLPARHFTKVAGPGVAIALDREHRRVRRQPRRRREALRGVAPQARRQYHVAGFVKPVVCHVTTAVLARLTAEQLGGARVVTVELERDARGRMAMAASVAAASVAKRVLCDQELFCKDFNGLTN